MKAETYHEQLKSIDVSPTGRLGRDYLKSRGLGNWGIVDKYMLGVVAEPLPGDEEYAGRLVIPYLTLDGVRGLKYRCLGSQSDPEHSCKVAGHGKYTQPHGQAQRLYNAPAYFSGLDVIGVCEGEIDAITASETLGIPTLGIPGAQQWKKNGFYWQLVLRDFGTVVVFGDGDVPGKSLATEIANDAGPSSRLVLCDEGEDINSMCEGGLTEELRRRAGFGSEHGDMEDAELEHSDNLPAAA